MLPLLSSVFAPPRPSPTPVVLVPADAPASEVCLARQTPDTRILILRGGVAGITDFLIVEARDELGGRMRSTTFGESNRQLTVELGANWIHGTREGNGPVNPIFELALKHNLSTVESEYASVSASTFTTSSFFLVRVGAEQLMARKD